MKLKTSVRRLLELSARTGAPSISATLSWYASLRPFIEFFLSGYFFPLVLNFAKIIALKVIHMTSNGSPEEKLRLMFRMYDKDGNGSIDAREMNE